MKNKKLQKELSEWAKSFISYVKFKDNKLYNEAGIYADEVEEGCI